MGERYDSGRETQRLLTDHQETTCRVGLPSCRLILAVKGFLGFICMNALRTNLSVTMVAMVNYTETVQHNVSECPGVNTTASERPKFQPIGEFDWDANIQGLILGAFFYGYMVTQIPGGLLAERFGGKWLVGGGVLGSAAMTLLIPVAARTSVAALVVTRIIAGLCEGVTLPAMHAMLARWLPPLERSKYGVFIYSGCTVGPAISMPISGFLCDSELAGGWPSVFYIFGSAGCLWFALWCYLCHSDPAGHPRIANEEREYIQKNLGCTHVTKLTTPWGSIFSSMAVWAITVTYFTTEWGLYTMMTCLPLYMRDVLGLETSENGVVSGIPFLLMGCVMIVGGEVADYLRSHDVLTTEHVRKLFTCSGTMLPAILLVAASYMGCDRNAAITLVTMAIVTSGLSYVGCEINHLDIAPPFAGALMGLTNCVATIPGFLGPQVVGALTKDDPSRWRWQIVLFLTSGIYTFGAVFYLVFAKGEEQEWSKANRVTSLLADSEGEDDIVVESDGDQELFNKADEGDKSLSTDLH